MTQPARKKEPSMRRSSRQDRARGATASSRRRPRPTAQPRRGRTVEELVSELMRPMLKTWLDENLPAIVERLVRSEIERISRARE